MSTERPEPLLITVPEAAALAGVGRTTAYQLCSAGLWPIVRIGRAVRVNSSRLRDWVSANTEGADDLTPTGGAAA